MTNADWIRSLSDEELGIWLCQISTCTYCKFIESCSQGKNGAGQWLKMERKEAKHE